MDRLPTALLLDLDDTILSFSAGKPDFWRGAFDSHGKGLPVVAEDFSEAVARVQGPYWSDPERAHRGRLDLWRARREVATLALAELDVQAPEQAHAMADHFTQAKEAAVAPFPGAIEALGTLRERGVRLGLVTNGSSEFQRRKLKQFDLERFFVVIAVEGELGAGKPDPRPFRHAMEGLAARPHELWMVGDNLHADVAGAQALGIKAVWNDHANAGLPEQPAATPDRIIRELGELL